MLQDKLLDTAVAHFGQFGFDAASTRAIAKASGTAMSSITYHFGGKEGLYLAAADHIAAAIRERMHDRLAHLPVDSDSEQPTREAAITRLLAVTDAFAEMMLDPSSANWSRYIVREQQDPTAAFERLYDGAMRHMVELTLSLMRIARADLSERERRALMVMLLGQCLVLRVGHASVTRILDVPELGDDEAVLLRAQARRSAELLLKGDHP